MKSEKLQEIKQTKFAKLIAASNGNVVIIKKKGNNKGFTIYKEEKEEEYKIPFFFNPFKRREKLLQEQKIIGNIIIQTFSYINLAKNKINKPIYKISGFKQCSI